MTQRAEDIMPIITDPRADMLAHRTNNAASLTLDGIVERPTGPTWDRRVRSLLRGLSDAYRTQPETRYELMRERCLEQLEALVVRREKHEAGGVAAA